MTFGATPTTGTQGGLPTNQFPVSSVYPPNKSGSNPGDNFIVLEGGPISTDDDTNKSSPASVYVKDGNNVAQGTTTDTAYSGSGAGTEIALLKKLVAQLATTLGVSVSSLPTLPAGTNVIGHVIADSGSTTAVTSLPALPAGSNLIGNVELVDSGGTNKATISAGGALKVDTSATTITANAGTNLNTSALALETGGNLATLAGGVSSSKYQVNVAQTLGATLSNTNPLLMEANLQNWLRNAQIFTVTTGAQAGASQTSAACLFNSSTGKSAFVFSVFVMNSNPGQGVYTSLRKVTTNPAFTNAVTPVCTVLSSGNTSLMTPTWQASASVTGTDIGTDNFNGGTNSKEMLQTGTIVGRGFLLANGANAGLSVYVGQGGTGGFWSVTYTYAEF